MRPAYLTAACGTALALCFASPSLAQSSQPERSNDGVRLAQPTRTPTAREIDATARSGDTALALFEGVWKVDVVMMNSRDSRWDIPVTTPSDPAAPSGTPSTDRPRDPTARPTDQPRTLPDRSNPDASARQPSDIDASKVSEGKAFTAYAEARVIMNGNMLQETMVLPRDAAMELKSATGSANKNTSSTRTSPSTTGTGTSGTGTGGTGTSSTGTSSTGTSSTGTSGTGGTGTSSTGTSGTGTSSKSGTGTSAVPQPVTPTQQRANGLDPSFSADTVAVTSFLSLDSSSGTFTKVCMDEHSGEIKHETGTYETESDRIVFTGQNAGDPAMGSGAMRDGAGRDGAGRDGMIDQLDRTRPVGSPDSAVPREPGASQPSSVATPTNRDPASGVSGTTRRGTTPPEQPTSTTPGTGSTSGSRTDSSIAATRVSVDGSRSTNGWDSAWGKDCRVVVDILGPNERRVTVYKMDSSMPGDLIPGSPERGVGDSTTRTGSSPDDEVRAKSMVAGQIVCQATYTRVSGSEAETVRQLVRDNDAFAYSDRD